MFRGAAVRCTATELRTALADYASFRNETAARLAGQRAVASGEETRGSPCVQEERGAMMTPAAAVVVAQAEGDLDVGLSPRLPG